MCRPRCRCAPSAGGSCQRHFGMVSQVLAHRARLEREAMILLIYQLVVVFIFGAIVGSFCNVAVARMPYEKSLLWPGSSCGSCYQPVRWYHNLPLISYLWLGGKCSSCGATFSSR